MMYQVVENRCHWWELKGTALVAAGALGLLSCDGMVEHGAREFIAAEKRVSGPGVSPAPRVITPNPGTPAQYVPQQLLVRYRSGTPARVAELIPASHGGRVLRSYRVPSNLHLIELPAGMDVPSGIAHYREDPNVLYAQPNYQYQLSETIPDDALFGELWGMHNLGNNGYADADIDAPEAWDVTTGSADVILGVLDTGIDYNHEDLAENVFSNPGEIPDNGVDDDTNGYVDDVHGINAILRSGDPLDDHGHGTHVSGTIAARGNNAVGVAGVNWEARLLHCKAFDISGGGSEGDILACMQYFLDLKTRAENPVNIIATNNSWSSYGWFSQALLDAITAHAQASMLFVAAAGNDYGNDNDRFPVYPASYDLANIIAVAATSSYDELAYFSNYGRRSVDVAAPGENILSTIPGGGYEYHSGTSMATPHVTGLIGLLSALDPTLGPAALKNLIMTGGDEPPGTTGRMLSGRRINAFGSLTCQDRVLSNRFAPSSDELTIAVGTPVALGVLSIVCAEPNPEPQTVTVRETGDVITLVDDSGSGSFEGSFTPLDFGTFTLEFASGDVIVVHAVSNYDPAVIIDFEYRDIQGTRLPLYSGDFTALELPFPIHFANDERGFNVLYVGSNGVLSFTDHAYDYGIPLPSPYYETVVAPMWTSLYAEGGHSGVYYEVLGTAPRRELVVEWRNMTDYYYGGNGVTFQIVFFENSPNILFSYEDVIFGDRWRDYGRDANIGIQVAPGIAQQFSFFNDDLRNHMTLFWGMGAPMAAAGPDQVVLPGAEVTLDGSASRDLDGEIVLHVWTQVAGTPVLIRNQTSPVASFTAPQQSGTLTFELWVVDDEGNIDSDTVDVLVNQPPVADAGEDYMLGTGLRGTLDATGSTDPDSVITGYEWRQINGDPVEILDAQTPIASFIAPATPQYLVFELIVTDEHGFQDSDVVVVEVFHNDFPVAVAGADRSVPPGSIVTLDGSASHDPDGTIAGYAWEVTACMTLVGPCVVDLTDADTATPTFETPGSIGFIHFTLTVTDDAGATASDTMTVVVFQ